MNHRIKILIFLLVFFASFKLTNSQVLDAEGNPYKSGISNILNAKNPSEIGLRKSFQVNEDKLSLIHI